MKILLSLIFIMGNLTTIASITAETKPNFPIRPIRIITTDPGGAADIAIRLIAPSLSASLNQPVYVDNRSGGGAITAIETVINSQADGYTLLLWLFNNAAATIMCKGSCDWWQCRNCR